MKKNYSIHNKQLIIHLFDNLKTIIGMMIIIPIYTKFRYGNDFVIDQTLILIFIGTILFMNIPALILFINYHSNNKNIEFTLDQNNNKILITKETKTKEYSIEQIKKSTYNLGLWYQNGLEKSYRMPLWTADFGYWDLTFENGDRYYLTNLLHDFLLEQPITENTKYRFRFIPFIDKSTKKSGIEFKESVFKPKSRTSKLTENYKNKTIDELNYILENKNKYQKDAIKVAEKILKEKNVG
ncbi:hypothetical protein [Xanthomarina gelatinilytica]|uniref:hypothetical protein n=1 Tax=Xanthomarina gelatinilytica TaxID=1137281 RepID=UPI003AA7B640